MYLPEFFYKIAEDSRTLLTYCKITQNKEITATFNLPYINLLPLDDITLSGIDISFGISGHCRMGIKDKQTIEAHHGDAEWTSCLP
ncbi:MAG TPA: hypothetical protein PKW79_07970, partial [Rhabdochlamydiaceae bacterium]|nr:hypothetical protein [Rhabdochlamydiaceae bacterium]